MAKAILASSLFAEMPLPIAVMGSYAILVGGSAGAADSALGTRKGSGTRRRIGETRNFGHIQLGLNQDDAAIDGQRVEQDSEAGALVVRKGDANAAPQIAFWPAGRSLTV